MSRSFRLPVLVALVLLMLFVILCLSLAGAYQRIETLKAQRYAASDLAERRFNQTFLLEAPQGGRWLRTILPSTPQKLVLSGAGMNSSSKPYGFMHGLQYNQGCVLDTTGTSLQPTPYERARRLSMRQVICRRLAQQIIDQGQGWVATNMNGTVGSTTGMAVLQHDSGLMLLTVTPWKGESHQHYVMWVSAARSIAGASGYSLRSGLFTYPSDHRAPVK